MIDIDELKEQWEQYIESALESYLECCEDENGDYVSDLMACLVDFDDERAKNVLSELIPESHMQDVIDAIVKDDIATETHKTHKCLPGHAMAIDSWPVEEIELQIELSSIPHALEHLETFQAWFKKTCTGSIDSNNETLLTYALSDVVFQRIIDYDSLRLWVLENLSVKCWIPFLPSGSGFDDEWTMNAYPRTVHSAYHVMNENGYYVGWIRFKVTFPKGKPTGDFIIGFDWSPSELKGIDVVGLKDYIEETIYESVTD